MEVEWLETNRCTAQNELHHNMSLNWYFSHFSSSLLRLCCRFPQAQSQFGWEGDQAFTPVSGTRAALQRPIQHPKREARTARHQRQVQGPDWRGGGEEGTRISVDFSAIPRTVKASKYINAPFCSLLFFPFVFIWDNFVLCCCRRASATPMSGRGAWKALWRFVFVCVLYLTTWERLNCESDSKCSRVIKITKIHWNVFFSQDFTCHVCLGYFIFLKLAYITSGLLCF